MNFVEWFFNKEGTQFSVITTNKYFPEEVKNGKFVGLTSNGRLIPMVLGRNAEKLHLPRGNLISIVKQTNGKSKGYSDTCPSSYSISFYNH